MSARRVDFIAELPVYPHELQIPEDIFEFKPDHTAYAFKVEDAYMEPEIMAGDTVVCSPTAPLAIGKFVAIWRRDRKPWLGMLMELPAERSDERATLPAVPAWLRVAILKPAIDCVHFPGELLRAVHTIVTVLKPSQYAEARRLGEKPQLLLPPPRSKRRPTSRQVTA